MSFDRVLMGTGFSAGQALGIDGFVSLTITAAGTTQATATALQYAGSQQVTTATAGQGVICPVGQAGDNFLLLNTSGNPILVYPPVGSKFNKVATNGSFTLADGSCCEVAYFSNTQLTAILSA